VHARVNCARETEAGRAAASVRVEPLRFDDAGAVRALAARERARRCREEEAERADRRTAPRDGVADGAARAGAADDGERDGGAGGFDVVLGAELIYYNADLDALFAAAAALAAPPRDADADAGGASAGGGGGVVLLAHIARVDKARTAALRAAAAPHGLALLARVALLGGDGAARPTANEGGSDGGGGSSGGEGVLSRAMLAALGGEARDDLAMTCRIRISLPFFATITSHRLAGSGGQSQDILRAL